MNETDRIRLAEFVNSKRRFGDRQSIYSSALMGLKRSTKLLFWHTPGKTLFKRLVFENSVEGFRKLLAQAEAMKVQQGLRRMVFGMEPTGNHQGGGEIHKFINCHSQLINQTGGRLPF